jgi:hypothetical protein
VLAAYTRTLSDYRSTSSKEKAMAVTKSRFLFLLTRIRGIKVVRFAHPDLCRQLDGDINDCALFTELHERVLSSLEQGETLVLNLSMIEAFPAVSTAACSGSATRSWPSRPTSYSAAWARSTGSCSTCSRQIGCFTSKTPNGRRYATPGLSSACPSGESVGASPEATGGWLRE